MSRNCYSAMSAMLAKGANCIFWPTRDKMGKTPAEVRSDFVTAAGLVSAAEDLN
jgi:hypothetical protein